MPIRITQEILRRLSAYVSHAQPIQVAPPDLEANETVSVTQDLLLKKEELPTPASHVLRALSPLQPTPRHVTLVSQASSLQVWEPRVTPAAQIAPAAASHSHQECPRASPVLRPPGRTLMQEDL